MRPLRILALLALALPLAALAACHAQRVLAPLPPLRAASAALYAVDVEFAEPLDASTAQNPTHYRLVRAALPGVPVTIASATMIDTLDHRTVQLIVPEWFGDSTADRIDAVVSVTGLNDYLGRPIGARSVTFRTGLDYKPELRAIFDAHCTACHGPQRADGTYRTDSPAALRGPGTDATPNLVAGNPTCLLVKKCKPHNSMFNLGRLSYFDFEMIRNWVEIYMARP